MKKLTKLKRGSVDLGFTGVKSIGKTLAMTFYLYIEYLKGRKIYTNYPLNFEHIMINTFQDLNNACDGVVCVDDSEYLLSSKFLKGENKSDVIDVMLNFGKRNLDYWYSLKRFLEGDKSIRSLSTKFVFVERYLRENNCNTVEELIDFSKYINNYYLELRVYDRMDLVNPELYEQINDLEIWCNLYDTTYEVKNLVRGRA